MSFRSYINIVCSLLVLATNIAINFILSPFIVASIGVEANGFVMLANNFVTYAQLLVTALNSMAARFITIEYTNKNFDKANLYYNSVFWGNLLIVLVLILPAILCIYNLETIFNLPSRISFDVKVMFSFVFLNFFLATGLPNWDCGAFASNRLDRTYIPQAFSSVIRCVVLLIGFSFFTPHVWYVGAAATIMTAIQLCANAHNTHILTPELKVRLRRGARLHSLTAIKTLVLAGVWNSISSAGNLLLSGLDILVCNAFLGATAMGIMSLSKIVPTLLQQLSASICGAFVPELTINYAKNNSVEIRSNLQNAMRLTSFLMAAPLASVIIFGDCFFALWVPSQDPHTLHILSILAIFGYAFTSGTQPLYNVFSVVNRVRPNAIAMIISGIASIAITLVLLIYTDLGMFAIAGVSSFVNLVRNMTFTLPATAKYLHFNWRTFYPQVGISLSSTAIGVATGAFLRLLCPTETWGTLLLSLTLFFIVCYTLNFFVILNKTERQILISKISRKIKPHGQ